MTAGVELSALVGLVGGVAERVGGLDTVQGVLGRVGLAAPVGHVGEPRVVLVTGASSGIGEACARRGAGLGDHLVLLARREDALEELAAECRELGASSATVVTADVGSDEDVAEAVATVLEEHGRIDAVLHSAGVVTYGRTEEVSPEDFEQVLSTNLLGSANLARHVVPVLRRQERGVLVLVGSLLGHIGVPEMTPYVVSKWGVRALARQLRMENADLPHVHIAHVAPGSVDTPIYDKALDSAGAVNSPPPPVVSPEKVATVVYRQVSHPRASSQTQLGNHALIAAFNLAPAVWDRLSGPAFRLLSRGRER
jgi:NAD(P)-dependent dehydrogenase (short-subunit alcohol dehydrogenase family)